MSDAQHTDALRPETLIATAGVADDPAFNSVSPPIHLSANYAWRDPLEKPQYDYARSGNPSRTQLEDALAQLEGGARGVVVSSGMAALDLLLNLVDPGEVVIAPHDCYGGTHRLLTARAKRSQFELVYANQTDPEELAKAFARKPKLVLVETPSNPLLRITDIRAVVELAKECGAIVAADNTFLSPALQRPLDLGCDIVVHSTTKFINGHSDVVGGAVVARDQALGDDLAWWANCTGVSGAPFDSFMTLRGLRTLFPRIERQQATAGEIVTHLENDARIENIYFPGLKSHPGHETAKAQQKGFGSMFSIEFAEGVDVIELLRQLNLFTIAESLGGFESLVCTPATMTHAAMTPEARETAGISDRLVRFSIGLEHAEDLVRDIEQALDVAGKAGAGKVAYLSKGTASKCA
ncbi:cystathionine gamma-synthase [Hyphococcus luteus]|uniref:O-succinylhomoserine (Thiol)-lyase n=1 Tax=Hyphococcus luteus TaxID=2058213 RepID=A0A2S7JZD4_9PROT|nr:cystathionine gamma-synthase [Marinicaulis flavus]PQA85558.1 O-succinylhomoserine (thiol)-lyase [Marinicaulis flavus]